MLEPHYDSYPPIVAMAGGTPPLGAAAAGRDRPVRPRRRRTGRGGRPAHPDADPATRPHNPTGTVLTREELAGDRRGGRRARPDRADRRGVRVPGLSTTPCTSRSPPCDGMAERTVTISSAGKTFNTTGWKIGWACGPAPLIAAVRAAKQFLTYVGGAPFQPAVAGALRHEMDWVAGLRDSLQDKRDRLCAGLAAAGLRGVPAAGHLLRDDRHPAARRRRRHAVLPGPARAGPGWSRSRTRCSTTTRRTANRSSGSRSASATRSSTRPSRRSGERCDRTMTEHDRMPRIDRPTAAAAGSRRCCPRPGVRRAQRPGLGAAQAGRLRPVAARHRRPRSRRCTPTSRGCGPAASARSSSRCTCPGTLAGGAAVTATLEQIDCVRRIVARLPGDLRGRPDRRRRRAG